MSGLSSNAAPGFVKAKTWRCREVFPFIFLWHHAEGHAPSWEPPEAPVAIRGPWKMAGRFERSIRAHYQDIAENVADVTHLDHIHAPSPFLSAEEFFKTRGNVWKGRWIQFDYEVAWSESGITSLLELEVKSKVLGRELQFLTIKGCMKNTGPVFFHTHFLLGKWRFHSCFSVTPSGLLTVDAVHYLFMENNVPWIFGKLLHYGFIKGTETSLCGTRRLTSRNRPW